MENAVALVRVWVFGGMLFEIFVSIEPFWSDEDSGSRQSRGDGNEILMQLPEAQNLDAADHRGDDHR